MRTIDITTSQHVVIRYELAALRDRIMAWMVDMVVLYGAIFLLFILLASAESNLLEETWFIYMVIAIVMLYPLVMEVALQGQTLGKRALRLRIVRLDGRPPSLNDYVLRWAFRMIDIALSAGAIAMLLISSTEKAQRLGGMVSNTVVVRLNPSQRVGLQELLALRGGNGQAPVFEGIRQFNDTEMLLVKEVLDRVSIYPNPAHYEALFDASDAVSHRLGRTAPEESDDAIRFLRQALEDYVVQTR